MTPIFFYFLFLKNKGLFCLCKKNLKLYLTHTGTHTSHSTGSYLRPRSPPPWELPVSAAALFPSLASALCVPHERFSTPGVRRRHRGATGGWGRRRKVFDPSSRESPPPSSFSPLPPPCWFQPFHQEKRRGVVLRGKRWWWGQ